MTTIPDATLSPLVITLFGSMQVLVHGVPLPHLRSRKTLWLLALLTLRHGQRVEREWLAGTLWPEMHQSQGMDSLRPILSDLRRVLGSQRTRLQSPDRLTLLLDLTGADVDVHRFDASIKCGKLSDLEVAAALYQGALLEGCYEEWISPERTFREQNCLQALQQLGDNALAAENYRTAIGYYQRAVSLDPWSETARRGWMEALAQSGDRNAALHVYRQFVELLRDDPNAYPDEQTGALYQRLRTEARRQTGAGAGVQGEAKVSPRIAGYLPHPLTDLVGREDERLEVSLRLRGSRLVTLTGLGGIGKTRLALEIAADVVQDYADGVWLVALEALADGKLVTRQIASVLGICEEQGRSLRQSVIEQVRTKRLLLVLDNCGHLLESSAEIAGHLFRECEDVRILATSREALGITGETVWAVPPLAIPAPEHLPQASATLVRVLMGYESVQLFIERAEAVQKSFALTGENAAAVARICSQLEGMPLAIELAAARVKVLTVEQIAAHLKDHLNLLTGGSRIAMSRQQTLRTTLDWSHELLQEPERRLLRRLAVFVGGWTLQAAQEVCSGESITSQQVLDLLTSLVDKSLVVFGVRDPESGGRYHLFEMVRQYAVERLQVSGEVEQMQIRHRDWCLRLAEQAEPELRTGAQEMWLRRLESEHDNLQTALNWGLATSQESEAELRLAGALWRFWDVRGHYNVGWTYLNRVLAKESAQARTAARAKAFFGAGTLAYGQGNYAVAQALYHECLGIRKELHDRQGTAETLSRLGLAAADLGDPAFARSLHEESLGIRKELGHKKGIADSCTQLGNLAFSQADYTSARSLYAESLDIRRALEDRQGISEALHNLGLVASSLGDYASAWSLNEESLDIRRELGHKKGIAYSLNDLGNNAFAQGNYSSARSLYEESHSIRRELGDRRGAAYSLNNLGNVALYQGEYATSRKFYEQSLNLYRELGYRSGIALTLGNMGELMLNQGDYTAAWSLYAESLSIRRELGERHGIAHALEGLGCVAYDRSDYSAARTLHTESLHLFREIRDLWGVADSLKALGAVMLAQAETQQAVCLWGAAHVLRENIGAPMRPADCEKYDMQISMARSAVGEEAFAAAWSEGCTLTWEQVVAQALEEGEQEHPCPG